MDLPGALSLDQRVRNALTKLDDRITSVRRTRPTTSVGSGLALPAAGVPGTRHFDTAAKRLWVYADGEWVSADSERWVASDGSTVSTAAGRWQDLGGPSLTFTLTVPAVVQVHLDVELFAATWSCPPSGTCLTRAEVALVVDGAVGVRAMASSNYNAWTRKVSNGWADTSVSYDSLGGDFPRGAFISVPLLAGAHTLGWRYAAINETPGGPQPATTVQFRGRVMHVLVL